MLLAVLRLVTTLGGHAARRAARVTALLALALLFGMLGLTGFAVAGFVVLARVMDPALAALLLGALCCGIAAVLLLIARGLGQRPPLQDQTLREMQDLLQAANKSGILLPAALAVLGGFLATFRRR